MPRLVYLIKERLGSAEAPGPPSFSQAWAERVRRIGGRFRAENIQVPVVTHCTGGWRLEGRRLADRSFDGHAQACPPPGWYACDTPAAPAAAGIFRREALEQRLRATAFGRMCLHPEIRLALAQDKLASVLEPLLRIPDLLVGEDRLAETWRIVRPLAAAEASASADLVPPSPGAAAAADGWRRRLRLAALRRLDTAAVGRETYLPCPAYFGEPYLSWAMPAGFTLKAGLVREMMVWPEPPAEAQSRAWRTNHELVAAVESGLCPVLAPSAPASALEDWRALAGIREFEIRSARTLSYPTDGSPDERTPAGFRVRIRRETMQALGGSYRTLATAGLSPYLPEPFGDYCETQRERLEGWAEDPIGLAMTRWTA